jgi:hypothetical protein
MQLLNDTFAEKIFIACDFQTECWLSSSEPITTSSTFEIRRCPFSTSDLYSLKETWKVRFLGFKHSQERKIPILALEFVSLESVVTLVKLLSRMILVGKVEGCIS